jgi:hypothetical protein
MIRKAQWEEKALKNAQRKGAQGENGKASRNQPPHPMNRSGGDSSTSSSSNNNNSGDSDDSRNEDSSPRPQGVYFANGKNEPSYLTLTGRLPTGERKGTTSPDTSPTSSSRLLDRDDNTLSSANPACDTRSAASVGIPISPEAVLAQDGFPSYENTPWADPIAAYQISAAAAKEAKAKAKAAAKAERQTNGQNEGTGGRKSRGRGRKRGESPAADSASATTTRAPGGASCQPPVQPTVEEAQPPPGDTEEPWGDPNEPW